MSRPAAHRSARRPVRRAIATLFMTSCVAVSLLLAPALLGPSVALAPVAAGLTAAGHAASPSQAFKMNDGPQELPAIRFDGPDGSEMTLEDFQGRTILLNIWATWCPPCVKEMPTLDALQARLGSDEFEVVILSIDKSGPEVVRAFLDKLGVTELEPYIDETMLSLSALKGGGLPVTLLIDPEGREIGRLTGPAEWDSEDMISFLESAIP